MPATAPHYTQGDRYQLGQHAAELALAAGKARTGQEASDLAIGFTTYLASLAPDQPHGRLRASSRTEFAAEARFLRDLAQHFITVAAHYDDMAIKPNDQPKEEACA